MGAIAECALLVEKDSGDASLVGSGVLSQKPPWDL